MPYELVVVYRFNDPEQLKQLDDDVPWPDNIKCSFWLQLKYIKGVT